jgi:hypothetical protein
MWDMLLLPRGVYQRITDKRLTLYLGILFVGIVDVLFPLLTKEDMFYGKPQSTVTFNIILICIYAVVLGLVDVISFSYPMFDFMRLIKKKPADIDSGRLVSRVMKVYVTVHFIIIPFNLLFFFVVRNIKPETAPVMLLIILELISIVLIPLWFTAALYRGISTIFNLDPMLRRLVFIAIFAWNYLLGYALDYVRVNWMMTLFR